METLINIENLNKKYAIKSSVFSDAKEFIHVLNNVNLEIKEGEILALVGESGCGKSTLGKCILNLLDYENGSISFKNKNIKNFNKKELFEFRRNAQLVFQNPFSSLNPKMTIFDILKEPLEVHKIGSKNDIKKEVIEIIKLVGLSVDDLKKYPHEFSGGQRQRIAIARALILKPKFLITDEPVSALDVSIQAQIINLLLELKEKLNLTILFISHDLNVVKFISNRVAVMYLGEIVEISDKNDLFNNPKHPYTKALLSAIPNIDNEKNTQKILLQGELPSLKNLPSGCKFHTRCPIAEKICENKIPENIAINSQHSSKCHFAD